MNSDNVQENIKILKERRYLVHDKVYRVKIEASLGCNKDCEFCGMTRKESCIMKPETFDKIVSKLPNTIKRVEFILHGEPTLNPNLPSFIEKIRISNPKTQISVCTNGFRFITKEYNPDYVFDLFDKGLNLMQVDLYDLKDWEVFTKLVQENMDRFKEQGVGIKDLYSKDCDCNVFFSYQGNKNKQLIYVKEFEGLNSGGTKQRRFHTFGGNIPVEVWSKYSDKYTDLSKFPLTGKGKTCASLLKYLAIGANGDIYLCCREASHSMNVGNILTDDLTELWNSDKLQILRYVMKSARRDLLAPCFLCSRYSYRDPLYPYWGRDYTKEECIDLIESITDLKDDVLLYNLIEYREQYGEKIPEHILKSISKAENLYKIGAK